MHSLYQHAHTYTAHCDPMRSLYHLTHTHTHTQRKEYYSAIKKNEIMPFSATWMDLEITILGEVNQTRQTNI